MHEMIVEKTIVGCNKELGLIQIIVRCHGRLC